MSHSTLTTQLLLTEPGIKLKSQIRTLHTFTNGPCAPCSGSATENQYLPELTDPIPKMLVPHFRGVFNNALNWTDCRVHAHDLVCNSNYTRHGASNFGDLDTEKAETDINTFFKILQK